MQLKGDVSRKAVCSMATMWAHLGNPLGGRLQTLALCLLSLLLPLLQLYLFCFLKSSSNACIHACAMVHAAGLLQHAVLNNGTHLLLVF